MKIYWLGIVAAMQLFPFSAFSGADSGVLGTFRNTYYYVVLEDDYADEPAEVPLLSLSDEVLAKVSRGFKKALTVEGTGKLRDGRVLNFAGVKNHETRYRITPNPYGEGVGNCALIPFHSIAVDPKRIPLGSVVQIDETVGMKLPDGTLHDGIWRAEDVGSAIQNDRVDLFVGTAEQGKILQPNGITNLKPLTIRLVSPPTEDSCVNFKNEQKH